MLPCFQIMLGMAILAFGLTLADPDSDPAYGYRRYGRYGRYYGGYRKYSPYLSGRGYYGKPHPYAYKPGSTIPFPKVAPKIGADPVLAAQAAEAARGAHAAHAAHNGGHVAHHPHAVPSVPAHPAPAAPSVPAQQVPVELSRAVPQLAQRVPQLVQQVPQQVSPQVVPQLVQQQPQLVPQQVPQQFVPQQVPQQLVPQQVPQQAVPQVPQQVPRVLPQRVPQRVINQLVRQAIPKLVQAVRKEIASPVPIAAAVPAEEAPALAQPQLPELHIAGNGNGDIFRNNFPIQNNVLRAAEEKMMREEKMMPDAMPAKMEKMSGGKLRQFQPAPAGQGRFPAVVGPQDVSPVVIPQPDSEAVAILQPLAFGALGDTKAPFEPMFEFFGNDLDFNDLVGQNEADVAAMMQTLLMPIDPEQLPKALPAFPAVPSLPVGM